MKEELEVYDLDEKLIGTMAREQFYAEAKQKFFAQGKINRQIKSIRVLLLNSKGRIYLQKRSALKDYNAGLYDKTIGGHVPRSLSWEVTVTKECSEELGFPAAVIEEQQFAEAIRSTDLAVIGLFKKIDYISNFPSKRVARDGTFFTQPFMTMFYLGYYDGPIRFADGESSGIEVFSVDELREQLAQTPAKFTEDVKFMVEKYQSLLLPITR